MRFLNETNFNFIKWRWHAIVLSLVVILAGIGTVVARGGLPLGVDFSGGTLVLFEFAQPTPEESVRAALRNLSGDVVVQQYGQTNNQIMVRVPLPAGAASGATLDEQANLIETAVRGGNLGDVKVISREIVGPVIGEDLKQKGIWATITALGGILIYIGFRFRFSFAIGAIAATLHDLLVTVVMLTWFGYDLSLNTIAAILTITGYSVNDTIVVFDRVRENQRLMRRESLETIVNKSVNQTLGRTIITAGTTFLAVLALFLFGGEVLRGLSFTLLVGVVTGTYSTVFIAAAIAIFLSRRSAPAVTQAQARAKRA